MIVFPLILFSACGSKSKAPKTEPEDKAAKKMLQGIWVNEDEEYVAFRVKDDTIFYPDSTSLPVYFKIIQDTLVMYGANTMKYPIVKQTRHLFIFKNRNGDLMRLVLSTDPSNESLFSAKTIVPINQNQLIKRDTVVSYDSERYHCYVQVNPTTYKVIKATYNDEGAEVDNVYYDNIVNLTVYHGATRLFSGDFRKKQFSHLVPADFLNQAVLSDMKFDGITKDGISYIAVLVIPDSQSSYQVELTVNYSGRLKMRAK